MKPTLEDVAKWHERQAKFWSGAPSTRCQATFHAEAAAVLRDAMGEIERLRDSIRFCSGSCGPVFPIDAALTNKGTSE